MNNRCYTAPTQHFQLPNLNINHKNDFKICDKDQELLFNRTFSLAKEPILSVKGKTVAGTQFRMPTPQRCNNCHLYKDKINSLTDKIKELNKKPEVLIPPPNTEHITELEQKLNDSNKHINFLTSQNNDLNSQIGNLKNLCDHYDLKIQSIQKHEEYSKISKVSISINTDPYNIEPVVLMDDKEVNRLNKIIFDLENKMNSDLKSHSDLLDSYNDLSHRNNNLEKQLEDFMNINSQLTKDIEVATNNYNTLLSQCENLQTVFESNSFDMKHEISNLKLELEKHNREYQDQSTNTTNDDIDKYESTISQLNNKLSLSLDKINNHMKIIKNHEDSIKELTTDKYELKNINLTNQKAWDDKENKYKDEVKSLQETNRNLSLSDFKVSELSNVNQQLQNNVNSLVEEIGKRDSIIQQNLQSSIRLSVIAPTVNIHLGSKTIKLLANMPEKAIRSTLESNVLPNFTRIYTSVHGSNPEGLDKWLENIGKELQTSIQSHLVDCFKTNNSS